MSFYIRWRKYKSSKKHIRAFNWNEIRYNEWKWIMQLK